MLLLAAMTFYETSRLITNNKRNNIIKTGYLVYLSSPTLSLPIGQANLHFATGAAVYSKIKLVMK
jgi:hypothetical protein